MSLQELKEQAHQLPVSVGEVSLKEIALNSSMRSWNPYRCCTPHFRKKAKKGSVI